MAGVASMPGPSFTSVTRISCSGRCAVPAKRSVDSTLRIRICPWLHDPGRAAAPDAAASRYCLPWPSSGWAGPELLLLARPRQRPAAAVAAGDRAPRRDQGRQAPAGGAATLVPRVRPRARGIPRPGTGVLRPAPIRGVPGQPPVRPPGSRRVPTLRPPRSRSRWHPRRPG